MCDGGGVSISGFSALKWSYKRDWRYKQNSTLEWRYKRDL